MHVTFNGTRLTADEWCKIADSHKCNKCSSKLKIQDITATSVNIKNPDNIRVFCKACVKEHMNKMPAEQRERIQTINDELLASTERDWDLRGSSHAS